jgi:hypothetical protein
MSADIDGGVTLGVGEEASIVRRRGGVCGSVEGETDSEELTEAFWGALSGDKKGVGITDGK